MGEFAPRLERRAEKYRKGLLTNIEFVREVFEAARDNLQGAPDPVAALRTQLSPEAFAFVQKASRLLLQEKADDVLGFLPLHSIRSGAFESSPDFMPRSFVEKIAAAADKDSPSASQS